MFSESGRYRPGFNGPERLTWLDVNSWSDGACLDLSPDERDMVLAMSSAFVAGYASERAPHEPLACQIALASAEMISL